MSPTGPARTLAAGDVRVVDLAQPLGPRTTLWPGSRPFEAVVTADHDPDRYYARDLAVPEHAGTHFDAPRHFAPGAAFVEQVPAERLVCEAVVLDVRAQCRDDRDHALSRADIEAHEAAHGPIPRGAAVLVWTGWSDHLDDPARYVTDMRFPGVGVDAAHLLVERGVAGIGIDTLGIDTGVAEGAPAHRVTLGAGLWHLEGLVSLEQVPARGALLVVGVVKLEGGSGAPARPLALVAR